MNEIFFIGPGKSGTSYIYNILDKEGYFLGKIKESNYYLLDPLNALSLYRSEYGTNHIIDFSNTYFYNPQIALKIKYEFPNSKIVFINRNPIERMTSHYTYMLSRGDAYEPFSDFITSNKDLFLSMYPSVFLKHWKNVFNDSLIELDFEKINNLEYLQNKMLTLGIEIKKDSILNSNKYETILVKNYKYKSVILKYGAVFMRAISPKIFQYIKQSIFFRKFIKFGSKEVDKEAIKEEINNYFS